MLGMPYDYAIDVWSIGCTLYELYTGKILFTGDSNNQMLKSIMEIRGKMPPKTYRKGELAAMHFDDKGNFVSVERDKVLGKVCGFLFLCMLVLLHFLPRVGAAIVCIERRPETFGPGPVCVTVVVETGSVSGPGAVSAGRVKLRRNLHGPSRDPATMW